MKFVNETSPVVYSSNDSANVDNALYLKLVTVQFLIVSSLSLGRSFLGKILSSFFEGTSHIILDS